MSRKNYKEFANLIREADYLTDQQKLKLAEQMAVVFKCDNVAFDKGKFIAACLEDTE